MLKRPHIFVVCTFLRKYLLYDTITLMKIALFGGRFDPIHNGHLAVANEIREIGAADEVWFSLENQHQWRPIVASWEDRKRMVEVAIASGNEIAWSSSASRNQREMEDSVKKQFKIDETPIKLGGLTETLSVIRELRKKVQDEIFFVVGSDQIPTFPQWTHWEELQKEVTFLMVARKGFPIRKVPQNCIVIEDPNYIPLEDSATEVRERIKRGESITGFVPKKVEEYIIEHGLYK